jgi:pilus assembly protein CpaB
MILTLALGSAGIAAFAAFRYSSQRPGPITGSSDNGLQIVVAARDLPVGHFITEADVKAVRWPSNALPAGYVAQPSTAVGRGLITEVRTNGPILEGELAERGSGAGMPIIFPEGMRAVSVRVDEIVGVAGFVIPRTRVDVLLTMKPPSGGEQTYTQTILQNLVVLAAGQIVQKNEQGEPLTVSVVTLMVTPEQGEKLVLASSQGRIQLALRNMVDVAEANTSGIGDGRLLDIGRQPVRTASAPAAAPRPRTTAPEATVIETYKGGVRSLQRF